MPKYAALIYSDAADETRQPTPEERQEVMSGYWEFGQNAADVLRGGEALHPTATATTVHVEGGKGGKAVFTDGPSPRPRRCSAGST